MKGLAPYHAKSLHLIQELNPGAESQASILIVKHFSFSPSPSNFSSPSPEPLGVILPLQASERYRQVTTAPFGTGFARI